MRKLVYSGLIASGLAGIVGCEHDSARRINMAYQLEEAKNIQPVIRITCYWNSSPVALCTADMNGDGRQDIIVSSSNIKAQELKDIYVFLNNGDGSYTPQIPPNRVEKVEIEKR